MFLSSKKKQWESNKTCLLEEGEYLFVIKGFSKPFRQKNADGTPGRGWLPIETLAIGMGDAPIEPSVGPNIMLAWTEEEGFEPNFMGEGTWQKLNEVLGMPEADQVSTEDYKNSPFNAVIALAYKGEQPVLDREGNQRRNIRNLAPATQEQINKIVVPYMQKKGS